MTSVPITSWEIDGETVETVTDLIFGGSKITADGDCSHEIKRCLLLGRIVMTNLDSILINREITLPTKVHLVKAMVFPVVIMDVRVGLENWALKNWCFWTVVLEKTLESPLDCKEVQLVHPKENLSWIFIGKTDIEAETPILWPSDVKNWLIWKDRDAGKDWRWEKKGTTEDEMVEWHHRLNGHELVNSRSWWWTGRPGMCCSPWSHKELDKTEWLNWTEHHISQANGCWLPCLCGIARLSVIQAAMPPACLIPNGTDLLEARKTLMASYLLLPWLQDPLCTWFCQGHCDSSCCTSSIPSPHWNRPKSSRAALVTNSCGWPT